MPKPRSGLFARRSPEEASVPERLMRCVEKRDVPGLLGPLDRLDDEGWEAARRWYRKARTSIRKTTDSSPFRGFDKVVAAAKVEAVLCVALAPPASAAKWLRWEWLTQAAQVVTPLVVRRGRDWCADFVAAADQVPARADRWGLSGGMRAAWPVVLGTATSAADLPRKPAGLAELLRMLTQYVAEVPADERELPPSLVRLAEAKGTH